jgi:hypothetical protein
MGIRIPDRSKDGKICLVFEWFASLYSCTIKQSYFHLFTTKPVLEWLKQDGRKPFEIWTRIVSKK